MDQCEGHDDNLDADGDTVADGCDVCLGDDASGDVDGDGTCYNLDKCIGGNDSADSDEDGMPDDCDVDLYLHEGNNLVSFYALGEPDGSDFLTFFANTSVDAVIAEGTAAALSSNGTGEDLSDDFWVGGLTNDGIEAHRGYWLRADFSGDHSEHLEVQGQMTAPYLSADGTPLGDVVSYSLHDGGNLISYPYSTTQSLADALPSNVVANVDFIVGEGVAAMNLGGTWVGSLSNPDFGGLRGGDGYWFVAPDIDEGETVDFQYNAPSVDFSTREIASDMMMPVTPEGFEYTQSTQQGFYFVKNARFDGEQISQGDWIVAYNDNVVVGSWPWNGAYTTVPAMGYDNDESTAGYMVPGEVPTFKLLTADGNLTNLDVVGDIEAWSNNVTSVIELTGITPMPTEISLNDAYPNPFNPSTTISFSLPAEMHVNLAVYDISGRLVVELMNEVKSASDHSIVWNAIDNSSGVYFVKLTAGNSVNTQKIMLIK